LTYPDDKGTCDDGSTPSCDDGMDARFKGLSGLGDAGSAVTSAAGGAAAGSVLGPIGSIVGAGAGILSSLFAGSAQKDAEKAAAKALKQQQKLQDQAVAAQQQSEIFSAEQAQIASATEQKTILIGLAGVAGIVVVGALAWRIAKGRGNG